jgi:hypothetical protein
MASERSEEGEMELGENALRRLGGWATYLDPSPVPPLRLLRKSKTGLVRLSASALFSVSPACPRHSPLRPSRSLPVARWSRCPSAVSGAQRSLPSVRLCMVRHRCLSRWCAVIASCLPSLRTSLRTSHARTGETRTPLQQLHEIKQLVVSTPQPRRAHDTRQQTQLSWLGGAGASARDRKRRWRN